MVAREQNNQFESLEYPEKKKSLEYKRKIAELFKIGLNSDDIYARHGTSIEAVFELAKSGKLPTSLSSEGDFFYVPENAVFEDPTESVSKRTEQYANTLAAEHYVQNQLPFKVKNESSFANMFDFEDELEKFIKEEAIPNGVKEEFVRRLVKEASDKRKGVVITLSKSIAQNYKEVRGDDPEDMMITAKDGLPLKYITGIIPLGQYEQDVLKKI